jgi:N-acetyl-anhydromuramyl-L-alanine amidase AmpD
VHHIRGRNTGSIGIAVCGMAGAQQCPFQPGLYPISRGQVERMCEVAAILCRRYGIAITPEKVFGHGEVQADKWDPMVLPWEQKPMAEVGNYLRDRVQYYYDRLENTNAA